MSRVRVLLGAAALAIAVGLWFALTAPPDALQGVYSRLINIHVPSLWLAFLAFAVTALGSVMWLVNKRPGWDRLAASSVEVGVLFTGIGLFTGMVWGNAVWGTAWDWSDPRLSTTAMMFFVYIGYMALRAAVDDPQVRARRSAILGTIAVIQVPLVYFSVNLFRSVHQTQSIRPDGATMPPEMLRAMLINLAAFTLLYLALLLARMTVTRLRDEQAGSSTVGSVVKPPRLSEVKDV